MRFFRNIMIATMAILPGLVMAEEGLSMDQITQMLEGADMTLTLISFFGFGLLLALTPCVLPMIPILSGIIIGNKDITTKKAFWLSVVFVLASSITYSIAGVLAGVFGENLQVLFQNPWALSVFSLIFVALAFSMFGFYEIQLPSFIQNKANSLCNSQSGGGYMGASIMGFLSALIVGPCVAPPLAGALIYIGQTGDALLGGLALFSLSIGMGIPLIAVGTGISKLPKAGGWMDTVKMVFGLLMLALAIWILDRIITEQISLLLWGLLLISSPIVLKLFDTNNFISRLLGLSIVFYAIMVIAMGIRGHGDMADPIGSLTSDKPVIGQDVIYFKKVPTLKALNDEIKTNDMIVVDFYADWCVSCKVMIKEVFSSKKLIEMSKGIRYIKIDVTENSEEDKEILKHYGIIGPPTVLFYKSGKELEDIRIVGEVGLDGFINRVKSLKEK